MKPVIESVVEKLGEETQCYRELLALVEQERKILLEGQHERLIPTSEKKLEISQRLAEAQGKRRELMDRLSGEGKDPIKLRDLLSYLPREKRAPFRAATKNLSSMAQRLARMNQENAAFITDALDTVEHLLAILTGQHENEAYGSRGGPVNKQSMPRLVAREV